MTPETLYLISTGLSIALMDQFDTYRSNAISLLNAAQLPADVTIFLRQQLSKNIDATVDLIAKNPAPAPALITPQPVSLPGIVYRNPPVFAPTGATPSPTSPTPATPAPFVQVIVPGGVLTVAYGTIKLTAPSGGILWHSATLGDSNDVSSTELFLDSGLVYGFNSGTPQTQPDTHPGPWTNIDLAVYNAKRATATTIVTRPV